MKKGVTAKKILIYLSIVAIIISGYLSLPEPVWIIEKGAIQRVCPSVLNTNNEYSIQLMNGGQIPAVFNVTFYSDKIKFIDDFGNIKESMSIDYRIEGNEIEYFKFRPFFTTPNNTSLQIEVECNTYFGKFCKIFGAKIYRCCYYYSDGAQLKLLKETTDKCS